VRDRLVRKAFLRFETEPGQQAQVDFAELAVVDAAGETVMKYHMFLMVLGFSRTLSANMSETLTPPEFNVEGGEGFV